MTEDRMLQEVINRARAEGHQVGVEQGTLRLQGALAATESAVSSLGTRIAANVEALTRALVAMEAERDRLRDELHRASDTIARVTLRAEAAEAKIVELEENGDPAADEAPG